MRLAAPILLFLAFSCVPVQAQRGGRAQGLVQERGGGGPGFKLGPDVPAALAKAIRGQAFSHYEGRLTREYLHGPQNLKHDEIVFRDGPRTRIEFPGGSKYSGQIIVENAFERRYFTPDKNTIYILPPRREENFARLVGLARRADAKRVTLSEEPGERIAGLPTDQIVVKDHYNTVIQRLFIEPRSGVVLKRQVFDALGAQTGYFQFTEINLRPGMFDGSLFRLERPGAHVVTPVDALRETAAKEGFDPLVFPPNSGYRLEESRITNVEKQRVLMESFGSNHGRLTLFELKTSVKPERLGRTPRADFQVYSWERGGKWYVLIGPRTQDDLARLVQTLYSGTP